ncbi:hypothetical protein EIP91_001567 [Steccherinum ochraceum]|uniref:Uncharacterized protein n=1 Tax=Steccherinum ochraceum TaxID=92696 RepID=A0A4R0RG72_9APHY|nr:hypothetical protein EIP91_001567 [Steccherinum ochraceum]
MLAAATSSAIAVPLHDAQVGGYEGNAVVARDLNLVVRDVLQAVYARELADADVHTPGSAAVQSIFRRNRPPPPPEWALPKKPTSESLRESAEGDADDPLNNVGVRERVPAAGAGTTAPPATHEANTRAEAPPGQRLVRNRRPALTPAPAAGEESD